MRISTNGIQLEVAVHGDGPLCVLVHGWPETHHSWRHQVGPLVEAGYRVAVPDVRGYGDSDVPGDVQAYAIDVLAADVAGIIDVLGADDAVVIGHDWGAPIAWHTALFHPDKVRAVVGMSVPHLGRGGPVPPTQLFATMYPKRFFYILYFQEPGVAEAEFEADVRDALAKIYYSNSGDVSAECRAAKRARTRADGYLTAIELPDPFPAWLTSEDLDAYTAAFEKSGFFGGLARYRCLDADWHAHAELDWKRITQPALFLAGQHDSVMRYAPGMDLIGMMRPFFEELRDPVIIEGAGHWVQQEQPDAVNAALLDFLSTL